MCDMIFLTEFIWELIVSFSLYRRTLCFSNMWKLSYVLYFKEYSSVIFIEIQIRGNEYCNTEIYFLSNFYRFRNECEKMFVFQHDHGLQIPAANHINDIGA